MNNATITMSRTTPKQASSIIIEIEKHFGECLDTEIKDVNDNGYEENKNIILEIFPKPNQNITKLGLDCEVFWSQEKVVDESFLRYIESVFGIERK